MTKRKAMLGAMIASIASVAIGVIASHSAYADVAPVVEKWTYSQYYNCFQSELLNREIDRDKSNGYVSDIIFKLNSGIYDYNRLPSEGYYTQVNNLLGNIESINCRQVMNGIDNKISGILEQAGVAYNATWKNLSKTDELMQKLGYQAEDANTEYFFDVQMNVHRRTEDTNVLSLIFGSTVSEEDYQQGSSRIQGVRDANGNITWKVIDSNFGNELKVKINSSNQMTVTLDTPDGLAGAIAGCASSGDLKSNPIQLTNDIEQTKNSVVNEIANWSASAVCTYNTQTNVTETRYTYTFSPDVSQLIDEGYGSKFTNDGSEATAKRSILQLGHGLSTLALTSDERYDLYSWYLKKAIPNFEVGDNGALKCTVSENNDSLTNKLSQINLKSSDGKWLKYYVNLNGIDTTTEKYMDLQANAVFGKISLQTIIDWMNSHAAEDIPADECGSSSTNPETSDGIGDTTVVDPEDAEVNCFNAAGALGWILCPVIDFAQHTINAIYGSIVENFLEFRAEWLNIDGQGKSVYQAWQTFQSFANIIFVIVLLVVIFSQLTGVGIDNLGIKRVLPKLIVAAILINLSYLICMLFVDISNILGVGFNNIFSNIIVSIDRGASASTGAQVLTGVVTAAVGGAVGFLAFNSVTVGIFGSVIVVPLVLGLIATLVGVLFFFILLGARQAAIIMLVVVSPIAFACYMLPNTKSIFDRWLKMFEGLLLLFPICGLLMGGSAFASKVLMTVDQGFLGNLIGMLVGVVPFFFIPTLLRGAFAAMGNLGARISGIGQNISRGLGRAAVNSDAMKDFQTRMRAGVDRNGNFTRAGQARMRIARGEGRLGKISALRQRVGRAQLRNLAAYEKMQDEVDLASRPDLYMRDAEAKRFGRRQAAADSELVSSGVANRTGDMKDFVAGQSTFDEGTLAYVAMKAAQDGDVEMQYAATERMLAQGHHGAEAYRQVLATLEAQGNTAALENFAKAAKGSRNLGELKSGARSTFDYVSAITDNKVTRDGNGNLLSSVASGNSLNDYTNKVKYSNMSESQVIGMDREELSRAAAIIQQKRQSGEAFTEEEESLISQANKAFRNERIRGSAKESNQKLAAEIAGIPEDEQRRIVGDRIDVDHKNGGSNNSSTPTRGNMTDEQLRNLRNFYQRKVNDGTATSADRETINRIDQEMNIRENGPNDEQGTPI